MRTENSDSEKDLNANPESELNTNKPISRPDRFPESPTAQDEIEKARRKREQEEKGEKKDDEIELLASDVQGTVRSRDTSSDPEDIAGVADLDRGMKRGKRR